MGIHGRPHFAQRAMDGVEAPADGVVTVRFETADTPPGPVRSFRAFAPPKMR